MLKSFGPLITFIYCAVLAAAPAWAVDDGKAFEGARQSFWRAVAVAHSVDGGAVDVTPKTVMDVTSEFADLKTGDLRAFRAIIGGSGQVVQGYASLSGGPPAFARFRHIGSGGVASLLKAMQVLDAQPAMAIETMVERISWAYPEFGVPLEVPGRPWTREQTQTGVSLTWFTRSGSPTGALSFWRIAMHVDHHHNADVTRTSMPNPFVLKGTVTR